MIISKTKRIKFLVILVLAGICSPVVADKDTNTDEHEHESELKHEHQHELVMPAHHKASSDSYWNSINPEFNLIGNFLSEFSDNSDNSNRDKFRVREAEAAFQAFLLPFARVNVVGAMEQEYEGDHLETDFHLEEAYLSLLDESRRVEATIGRKLVDFGSLNTMHFHEWPFADTPLVMANLFGKHSWYDDGVSLGVELFKIGDSPVQNTFGYYQGRNLSIEHQHGHGHDDDEDHHGPIKWDGKVYVNKISTEIKFDPCSELDLGYSVAWDEGRDTDVHSMELTWHLHNQNSDRELTWQNELFYADIDTSDSEPFGFYSMLNCKLNSKWDIGGRYDWSEAPGEGDNYEWALSPFVTYHLNSFMFTRLQYRYREMIENHESENTVFVQFVVEFGSHSH